VEGSCEHGNEPSVSIKCSEMGKFLSSCATGGFSRRAQLHRDTEKSKVSVGYPDEIT
jgi:hypothetical protein